MAYGLEKIVSEDTPIYQQLTNYYEFCERRRLSARTMKNKICRINNFIKTSKIKSLEDITDQHIEKWLDYMTSKNSSGKTINDHLCQIKVMLRWQKDDNVDMPGIHISRITMQKELPPRKVFFTRKQIDKALSKANDQEWLLIKLAFDCGLRISELRNLRLNDIDNRMIRVVGKGQRLRYVKMSKEARKRLDVWIKRHKITNFLWQSKRNKNKPMCDTCTRRAMTRPFEAIGVRNFYPHSLRHSFATELKVLGISTRKIQAAMGHTSENITERYLSDLDGFDINEVYNIKYKERNSRIISTLKNWLKSL